MSAAAEKLCSIRHHCFVRGILGKGGRAGGDDDFRQAFRTVNRLYVQAKLGIAREEQVHPLDSVGGKRKRAA